ncbi:MAG: ComEA family DNA-binding protein [Gammaproteobacteria bacterium]|jgi:competence protein ComEA|nr:ComEA family DNA-binding protein [Gammaproteobacteria bacterium]
MSLPLLVSLMALLGAPFATAAPPAAAASSAISQTTIVNLNSADVTTLARDLVGIGPAKARAIVDYRTKNGPFRSIDDLALVKGIGQRTIELNRARLRISGAPPSAPPSPRTR